MTSNIQAEPRPPPLNRPPDPSRPAPIRALSATGLSTRVKVESGTSSPLGTDTFDDRPSKRRKIEQQNASGLAVSNPVAQVQHAAGSSDATPQTRLVGDLHQLSELLGASNRENAKSHGSEGPVPLPTRPWIVPRASNVAEEPKPTHRARSEHTVPTSPDALELPHLAPQLVNKKPAGYFPWTGKHPEDVLNDVNTNKGYSDRPPNPPEKELNTARVPLYNAFKHRSGIDSLSTLFSLILEAKNKHGLISSVSTFKPPPRVTLTEAKRKSWISDLANPEVPLRKLSRTIPQGIRGQILLDQCLQSAVPLSRAIWFAKCVGANEIRTLKRKGTTPAAAFGTETKWLREWTVNVEQFIETLLGQCGQPSWKSNVQYALRLTTRLYLENLLDRDYYLDWLVKSFAASSTDHLPFWLMMVHIYKLDIAQFRRRAKRVAEALLAKRNSLSRTTGKVTQALALRLQEAIRGFALFRPLCLLMPDQWPDVCRTVQSCLQDDIPQERQIFDRLTRINERCLGSNAYEYLTKPLPRDVVLEILDLARAPYNFPALSDKLVAACEDSQLLTVSCLEWATTQFRCGTSRVYLVSRLVRRWRRLGYDVDAAVLKHIANCHESMYLFDTGALKHTIAELSRSHTFSISKYMQWLTVRGLPKPGTLVQDKSDLGTMADPTELGAPSMLLQCADSTQLLLDLSLANVGEHVVNLRNSMLARAGFRPELELKLIDLIVAVLRQELMRLGSNMDKSDTGYSQLEKAISGVNWTVRCKVARWLRAHVAELDKQNEAAQREQTLVHKKDPFNHAQFRYIRKSLEVLEDDAVLADVLGLLSSTSEEDLLASFVETVSRHADAFSSIGALEPLHHRLCQTYLVLRSTKATMPILATALIDLCTSFPSKILSTKLLQQDLVRGDRGRAIAACSPFSDGIAESLQQAEATFIEDFEAVLQSEPNMNEQTMVRLFEVLVERVEKQQSVEDGGQNLFVFCQLLSRLRLCRKVQGEMLLKTWLFKSMPAIPVVFGTKLLTCLLKTGCMSVDAVVDGIQELNQTSPARKAAIKVLRPWLHPDGADSDESGFHYSVATKWMDFVGRSGASVLRLMAENGSAAMHPSHGRELVTGLVLSGSDSTSCVSDPAGPLLETGLNDILAAGANATTDLKEYIRSMDTLSAPFVQLRLRLLAQNPRFKDSADSSSSLVDILSEPINSLLDAQSNSSNTHKLLQSAGPEVATRVRYQAEENVLELLPKFGQGKSASSPEVDEEGFLKMSKAMDRVFQVCSKTTSPSPRVLSQLSERLTQFLRSLGSATPAGVTSTPSATSPTSVTTPVIPNIAGQLSNVTETNASPRQSSPALIDQLNIMLRLLCLQRPPVSTTSSTLPNPPPSKQVQTDLIKILTLLASIATHPVFASPATSFPKADHIRARETTDFVYDVMATLLDSVSEDARILCARIFRDKLNNGSNVHLRWLFGSINTLGSEMRGGEELGKGLILVKEGRGVVGEWKPKSFEVLEAGSVREGESCLGLGLFGARKV